MINQQKHWFLIINILLLLVLNFNFLEGQTQYALNFDGENDYVHIGEDSSLQITGELTLSAWVYYKAFDSYSGIISKGLMYNGGPAQGAYGIGVSKDFRKLRLEIKTEKSNRHLIQSNSILSTGVWYHIAGTFEPGVGMKIYINGELEGSLQLDDESISHFTEWNNNDVRLGDSQQSQIDPIRFPSELNGLLDEVRIWNIALTQQEIQEGMFRELAGTENGLVAYYRLNEGEGQIVLDLAGNNNGQLGSTPYVDESDPTWIESDFPFITEIIELTISKLRVFKGDTVIVPVSISLLSDTSFSSFEINISGFQNKLEFITIVTDSCLVDSAGWSIEFNDTDSLLLVASAGSVPIDNEGMLFKLKFLVPDTANGFIPIIVDSVTFDTGKIAAVTTSGGLQIFPSIYGDVDLNNIVQAFDASLILKYLIGKVELDTFQLSSANVSFDNTISALDASLILKYVVNLIDSLPYDPSVDSLTSPSDVEMPNLEITSGEKINIPIYINDFNKILAVEGKFIFNPNHLSLENVSWSEKLSNFTSEAQTRSGEFQFVFAGTLPRNVSGLFATLQFHVNENLSDDSTKVIFKYSRWNENGIVENIASSSLKITTGLHSDYSKLPIQFKLYRNYPNPFNPVTTIEFDLPKASVVHLKIFNILGKEITTLVSDILPAGNHKYLWDASIFASGLYLYRLEASDYNETNIMILTK